VNSTLTGAVATYLAQVRAELSDLPPGELEDVLEDVAGHLTEVAGEFEEEPTAAALQERLGTPGQYAAELRTAAGYPPAGGKRSGAKTEDIKAAESAIRWGVFASVFGPFFLVIALLSGGRDDSTTFGFLGLVALVVCAYLGVRALHGRSPSIVLNTPRGASTAAWIRESINQIPANVRHELVTIGQPVWWVARGAVGGGAFFVVFGANAVTVVGALAGAAVSIWIGRRTQQDPRWLWYVVPLNVVATIIVPAWLAASFVGGPSGIFNNYNDYRGTSNNNYVQSGLNLDGNAISNLYPFDDQGRQVHVRLYDQDGKPINLERQDCAMQSNDRPQNELSNFFPLVTVQDDPNAPVDADGVAICKDTDKAPFVPPPAPATPTTPSPSAGTTPTPTPTAGTSSKPPSTAPKPGATLTASPR
jgi:HAAS domain-containing protein